MSEQDWSAFACPNPDCPAYGHRGQGNLRPHGWSSKARNLRCLRCTTCGHHFSQRTGTPLFGTHLPQEKAVQIAQHLAEGNGMRATARLCGVSLNTVLRFARRAGGHAQEFHDQLVRHVEVHQVQVDEAWAFVGKKGQAL
jgi:transposase-like protein